MGLVAIHKAAEYILLKGTRQQCRLIKLTIGLHQSRLGRQQAFRRRRSVSLGVPSEVAVSQVVHYELAYGVCNSAQPEKNQANLDHFLKYVQVLEWGAEQVTTAAQVCCKLKHVGQPIQGPHQSSRCCPRPIARCSPRYSPHPWIGRVEGLRVEGLGDGTDNMRMRQPPENVIRRRAEAIRRAVVCYGCRTIIATSLRRRHTRRAVRLLQRQAHDLVSLLPLRLSVVMGSASQRRLTWCRP